MSDRMFVVALAVLVVGLWMYAAQRETPPDARIAQLEGRLVVLQTRLDSVQAASDRAAQAVTVRRNAIRAPDLRLSVDSAMGVALDTAATAKELRLTLIQTVDKVEAYQAEVLRYQESVDTLLMAHLRERQAFTEQIDTLRALVDAQTPTPCTAFGIRCPNRTTAFLLGVGSALLLAVAVAF